MEINENNSPFSLSQSRQKDEKRREERALTVEIRTHIKYFRESEGKARKRETGLFILSNIDNMKKESVLHFFQIFGCEREMEIWQIYTSKRNTKRGHQNQSIFVEIEVTNNVRGEHEHILVDVFKAASKFLQLAITLPYKNRFWKIKQVPFKKKPNKISHCSFRLRVRLWRHLTASSFRFAGETRCGFVLWYHRAAILGILMKKLKNEIG